MANWVITISGSGDSTTFGEPYVADADDLVIWNNTTDEKHQPRQTDAENNPLPNVDRSSVLYLADEIAAGKSSYPQYDVNFSANGTTVFYDCSVHPNRVSERGQIRKRV